MRALIVCVVSAVASVLALLASLFKDWETVSPVLSSWLDRVYKMQPLTFAFLALALVCLLVSIFSFFVSRNAAKTKRSRLIKKAGAAVAALLTLSKAREQDRARLEGEHFVAQILDGDDEVTL